MKHLFVVMSLLLAVFLAACTGAADNAVKKISPQDYVQSYATSNHLLLDVRTPEEFRTGAIAGAVNISLQELPQRLSEIPTNMTVIVYCRSGNRSAQAVEILRQAGYTPLYDLGGTNQWTSAGYDLVLPQ